MNVVVEVRGDKVLSAAAATKVVVQAAPLLRLRRLDNDWHLKPMKGVVAS